MSRNAAGLSLFDLFEPDPVPGLSYHEGYITQTEEAELIARIDRHPWSLELQRRRQWYGFSYDDTQLGRTESYQPQPMGEWLNVVARRLHDGGFFEGVPQRALVNEYKPGQGIGAHKDRDIENIKAVAILSLGSAVMMDFTREGHETRSHYLRPRSLVVMRAEVREEWLHGILPRKTDRVGGLVLPRGRRLSLTMRYAVEPTPP